VAGPRVVQAAVAAAPWLVLTIVPLAEAPLGLLAAAWTALLCGIITKTPLIVDEEVSLVYGAITTAALIAPVEWALGLGAIVLVVVIGRKGAYDVTNWE
jgi:hypothetical protein